MHRPFGLLGEAEAFFLLLGGGDVEGGDVGLGGVGRTECRDAAMAEWSRRVRSSGL